MITGLTLEGKIDGWLTISLIYKTLMLTLIESPTTLLKKNVCDLVAG